MPRFFVHPSQIQGKTITITGPDVQHINKVLRLCPGDGITVLDGRGLAYSAQITGCDRDCVICRVMDRYDAPGEPPVTVTLIQGLPKGDKMESIIQKSTELGVSRVVPAVCRRSVVQLSGDKAESRRLRWQRVALEAAKQSRRALVPEVAGVVELSAAVGDIPRGALAVIPWEEERARSLKDMLRDGLTDVPEIFILIGPEGGFEPREVDLAREHGVKPVTLGPRILRTETAGPAVLTMVLYQLGDLGGA